MSTGTPRAIKIHFLRVIQEVFISFFLSARAGQHLAAWPDGSNIAEF